MSEAAENRRGDPERIVTWLLETGVEGASQIEYVRDSILCEPNDPAELIYFIEAGQVRIHHVGKDHSERFSSILGRGAWVGVAALANKPKYSIRARVMAESLVWQMSASSLMRALTKSPAIAATVVAQLAARLFESYEEASRLVFHGTHRRVVHALLAFSNSPAAVPQHDGILLQMSQQELAEAVGAARETVSLSLMALRAQNLLRTGRNRLMFNPNALRKFADTQAGGQAAPG